MTRTGFCAKWSSLVAVLNGEPLAGNWTSSSAAPTLKSCRLDADQVEIARATFRRYGKGRHPAGLNFGDCFSYALVHSLGDTLLFKGQNFTRSDIRPAYADGPNNPPDTLEFCGSHSSRSIPRRATSPEIRR